MKKEHHKLGEKIILPNKTELTVELRSDEADCREECYYGRTVDCRNRLCNYDERPDKENIIYLCHE